MNHRGRTVQLARHKTAAFSAHVRQECRPLPGRLCARATYGRRQPDVARADDSEMVRIGHGHNDTGSVGRWPRRQTALLRRLGCETLLDVGCGDWNWMREVSLPCDYVGIDIVPEVIEANRRYERAGVEFVVGDAIEGPLPEADVALCREVLFHLSFHDGLAVLANIRATARWLLATSDTAIWFNSDIETGDYRRINLERAPYRLPRPHAVISDDGVCRGRVLALWATADLPTDRRGRSIRRSG